LLEIKIFFAKGALFSMKQADLVLIHPPSVYKFRELPIFYGPVSEVIPSTSIFENYPIGFMTLSEYLTRHGISVRIVNLANKMLKDLRFDPEVFVSGLKPAAFGIDLHWLPHADGSLSLAEVLKRRHPDTPVILGGLSSTHYHLEIMRDYPFVDFVMCGDSTEEPMRQLLEAIKTGGDFGTIPNLVWRNDAGKTAVNGLTCQPQNLDYVKYDYAHLFKMAVKYRDLSGYLPFRDWLKNPVMGVFSSRGCCHDCASCGGSSSAFEKMCVRERPAFRAPELLAKDIKSISRYTGAPVMVIGDLLQAGRNYADRFLLAMKKLRIKNEIAIEFFHPPTGDFVQKVSDSLTNFNVEISPESHDTRVRKAFGKTYDNARLEESIEAFVNSNCKRIDLFFMVGLPYQDYQSVMDTVEYCGELMQKYGKSGKILPFIAPLAPFVDPSSRFFEEPERFGYRLFYKTLKEHRQALLTPNWKQRLNYETEWMTRDDIVRATYDGALKLVELKAAYGLTDRGKADEIIRHIRRAKDLIRRMEDFPVMDDSLREEIFKLNPIESLCDRHEMEWPVIGRKLRLPSVMRLFFSRAVLFGA
jgi:B12-binding domain/radical SAM domain protein